MTESTASTRLIVGSEIIELNLLRGADPSCLKHATYDLTIGEIFPVAKEGYKERKAGVIESYAIKPNEAVWILSAEEFNMPCNITGIATLRTTYTKQGLVAFNVGIIDPFFNGPVSTVLLNFSQRSVEINRGEKFFRVLFMEHTDVSDTHSADESVTREKYRKDIGSWALNDFSQSFLDVPVFDSNFYARTTFQLFRGSVAKHPFWALVIAILLFAPIIYVWTLPEYLQWFESIRTLVVRIWDSLPNIVGNSGDNA